MKKLLSTCAMLAISCCLYAQTPPADSLKKRVDELTKTIQLLKEQLARPAIAPPSATVISTVQTPAGNATLPQNKHLSFQQKVFVTSPVWISVCFMIYFIVRLQKEGFTLNDALSDDPVITHVLNPLYNPINTAAAPATIDVTILPKSTSRLVAFFSGVAAIVISITTVSYFFYVYYTTGQVPDLDKMFTVILSLGIGVTPYAFNKVSNALAK